jgi:hypothetical protein
MLIDGLCLVSFGLLRGGGGGGASFLTFSVYHHEMRPCETMLMPIGTCVYGNNCKFRHVPLSGSSAKDSLR